MAVIIDIEDYRHGFDSPPPFTEFLLAGLDTKGLELPERQLDPHRAEDVFLEAS
ncbi:hypothetical protein G7067_01400 [Leucobacter insecticola]|uniref:Uncharacterized protein n=1 Tax=Leucobacter insecticola TaxID=2714934 RepID=A0A6G8FG77_9MICO|nr:hypothetical protein [Leucobacter insecticola]QIM15368.1 hypothetical protein G7067_01400 [Leucobacter insecticola]